MPRLDQFLDENFFGLRSRVIRALWELGLQRKLVNYLLAEAELKLGRRSLWSRPYFLVFDPNSGCDLHCPLCPTGKGKDTRTRKQLNWDHFRHTMDELGPTLLHVEFSNWGEPLLNPQIYDMIRYTKRFGVEVHLSSHFNHFSDEAAEKMIDSGLDWIILSIDGASAETYSKYRIGGDFNRVMRNLETLVAVKKRRRCAKPYIIWQFLVFRHNEHEIEKVHALGKEMGADVVGISPAAIGIPEMIPRGPGAYLYPERGRAAQQEMTNIEDYYGNQQKKLPLCVWPWLGTVINANGTVSPCCGIEDEKDDYGNAFERGFPDIWAGQDYREGRRFVVTRQDNGFKNTCTQCRFIGKNNFHIPDWWGTGSMGAVALKEIFRPINCSESDFPAKPPDKFRLRLLLSPAYIVRRARAIRSKEDFFDRIQGIFRYIYALMESAYYEIRGFPHYLHARIEYYYYELRGGWMPNPKAPFRLSRLLNPIYLVGRLRDVRSKSDFFYRIKNVFRYAYYRLDAAENAARKHGIQPLQGQEPRLAQNGPATIAAIGDGLPARIVSLSGEAFQPSEGSSLLNQNAFVEKRALAETFRSARPFKHIVIDGLFDPEFCRKLISEFPPFDADLFRNEHGHLGKAHYEKVPELGPAYRELDELLKSKTFLNLIGDITGIHDLLFDPEYFGGGTHENLETMELDPHVDFTLHPNSGLYRRVNLLLYLNREWEADWGGALELHLDPWAPPHENRIQTISPAFNRCVIFETSDRSWHGFQAISLPKNKKWLSRRSFALYLYTRDEPREIKTIPSDLTVFVDRPLPARIRPGYTLTEEDVQILSHLVVRRDWKLKYLYGRAIDLFNQCRNAAKSKPSPR